MKFDLLYHLIFNQFGDNKIVAFDARNAGLKKQFNGT